MNKYLKRIALVAGTLTVAASLSACSTDKSVATYKGGKITESQLYKEMKKSQAGKSTFTNLIIQDALEAQYGKKVSDKDVTAELTKYKKQYGDQFKSVLQQNGLTESSFKKSIRTNQLTKVALKDIKKISDADEKKAYDSYQPKITVQHILVADEAKAKEVETELGKGTKFEDLAKKYSTDTATKNDGGKLPAFDSTDTTLDSTFKEAAFKLEKVGDYTKEPVKSQFGYHIIKLVDKKEKGKLTDKDTKKMIDDQIYDSWLQDSSVMQTVIAKVIKKADVDIKDSDLKDVLSQYVDKQDTTKK